MEAVLRVEGDLHVYMYTHESVVSANTVSPMFSAAEVSVNSAPN